MSSVRGGAIENELLATAKSASNVENLPKLTAEYFDLPRRFALITPQGCFLLNKLRPVDQLTHALREANGPHSEAVKLFFGKIYERAEACALCLAVALAHLNTDARMYEWATQAFVMYGGEAEIRKRSAPLSLGMQTSYAAPAPVQSAFPQQQPYVTFKMLVDSFVINKNEKFY